MIKLKDYMRELDKSGDYNAAIITAHNLDEGSAEIGVFGDMFNIVLLLGQLYFYLETQSKVDVNDIGELMVEAYKIRKAHADGLSESELDELDEKFMDKFWSMFGKGGKYERFAQEN